ncbi:CHC2 zinc finger domain-containing protein [Cytophagaceae bacterium ABcell3]|nr:CHC2 zinc finger domain-containing protein [Cytophagaceae bacterium ABcell3]
MEIKELKARLDIIEVAQNLGLSLDRQNKTRCPFHNDKTPSLQFSKEKQICTCFSSNCTAGTMDVISLTEKYLKVTTHEAIKWLKENHHIAPSKPMTQVKTPALDKIALLTKVFGFM